MSHRDSKQNTENTLGTVDSTTVRKVYLWKTHTQNTQQKFEGGVGIVRKKRSLTQHNLRPKGNPFS